MNQRDAQQLLLQRAEDALDSARGVNLDEEAANLLRHEQMYQAAAQTISYELLTSLGRRVKRVYDR